MSLLTPQTGALVSRIGLGIVLLAHSVYLKLFVFGLPGTAQFFQSLGLPGFLAYLVFVIEAAAGIGLILGYRTRLLAAAVIPILLGATWAHWESGWLFTNQGGGWEYPLVLALMALAQFFAGSGRLAISHRGNPAAISPREEVLT